MPAHDQELITLVAGTAPRTSDEPLIYIDVDDRSLRMVINGMIIPLRPFAMGQQFDYQNAIDRMIAKHRAPAHPRARAEFRERR